MSDARPKRARLNAGREHIAPYPQAAVREALGSPTPAWQRRGAQAIGPWWRGHRYTLEAATASTHETLDSGPENDTEEPMPNACTNEDTPPRST
ncbi:MAG: hypothetical protein HIU89_07190 [Proteobacteria bacterium]|nr:hypothetical protein [Pseudomonadota bacterium]